MNKAAAWLIALTIFSVVSPAVPLEGSPSIIHVPGDYPTIQEAVNHASEGDTIRVASGTYEESVYVGYRRRGLSIVGEGKDTTFIFGVKQDYAVSLKNDGVQIRGFTIESHVYIWNVYGVTLKGNIINGYLRVSGSGHHVEDNSVDKIDVWETGSNYLTGNTVNRIRLVDSPNNVLRNNVIAEDLRVEGRSNSMLVQDIDESNLLNGTPVRYSVPYSTLKVPEEYPTIQSAIDAASDGDTVWVASGTYKENLLIPEDKIGLHLIGEDKETTIIDGNWSDATINVNARDVEITEFTIQNGKHQGVRVIKSCCIIHNNIMINNEEAISFGPYGTHSIKIRENVIVNNKMGIILSKSNSEIVGNNITNNVFRDLWLSGFVADEAYCINITNNIIGYLHIENTYNNIFRNNTIERLWVYGEKYGENVLSYYIQDIDTTNTLNGKPIYYIKNQSNQTYDYMDLPDAGYIAFINCTKIVLKNIDSITYDVLFSYSTNCVINNIVFKEGSSLRFDYSNNNTIENSRFSSGWAIRYWFSDENTVKDSLISDCDIGIYMQFSRNSSIIGNTIKNNRRGLKMTAEDTHLYYNNFINNTNHVTFAPLPDIIGETNYWDDGVDRGNFWSDYTGVDTDGDGIGDTPYVINENNQDNYPLMNPLNMIPDTSEGESDQPQQEEPQESPGETTPEGTTEPTGGETDSNERRGIPGFPTISIITGLLLAIIVLCIKHHVR